VLIDGVQLADRMLEHGVGYRGPVVRLKLDAEYFVEEVPLQTAGGRGWANESNNRIFTSDALGMYGRRRNHHPPARVKRGTFKTPRR
jgi:hypothetical protein